MEQKFVYNGKTYSLDLDDELSVTEARSIKQHAGMTVKSWMAGIQEGDVDAIVGMVFIAVRRAGDEIEWSDMDDLNLMDLINSMIDENGLDREAIARGEVPDMPDGQAALLNRAARRDQAKSNGSTAKRPARSTAKK